MVCISPPARIRVFSFEDTTIFQWTSFDSRFESRDPCSTVPGMGVALTFLVNSAALVCGVCSGTPLCGFPPTPSPPLILYLAAEELHVISSQQCRTSETHTADRRTGGRETRRVNPTPASQESRDKHWRRTTSNAKERSRASHPATLVEVSYFINWESRCSRFPVENTHSHTRRQTHTHTPPSVLSET